jgi:hypothetical protein
MSKLKTLAAAVGAMGAIGVAGQANAYVYALSHLEIQDLVISASGIGLIATPTYTFNLTNTATLNAANAIQSATCNNIAGPFCSTSSPVLDASVANAPGNTLIRAENDFSFLGPTALHNYATSDSVITSAQLVQFLPTATQQIAEVEMNSNGNAAANAEIQSNTNLNWIITLAPGSLTLTFAADPDQKVEINDIPGLYSAQSNLNASFSLTKNDGSESITWSPQGTAANDCIADGGPTCVETADGADLNRNIGTGTNPSLITNPAFNVGGVFASFGITISGLSGGTYSLVLNALTSANVTRVPEPGTIALLGAALAGIGFASRRKSKQA